MSGGRLGLVLGGGGVAGVAWHTGILNGLADAGVDVTSADLLIGTSAGATVAAQVAGGRALEELFARQVDVSTITTELKPTISVMELWQRMEPIYTDATDDADRRRRLGALALGASTVAESERRRVIEARLEGLDWLGARLRVVVVEAVTGDRRVLDASMGIDLVDAVTASCAVPGVWPPVTIGGSRYIDGGVWSVANVDLAAGCDRVLVLAPLVDPAVHDDIAAFGDGVRVELVSPDEASTAAFGTDVLDPVSREPSARAGRSQGRAVADRVGALLAA
jgi:NTE family protein